MIQLRPGQKVNKGIIQSVIRHTATDKERPALNHVQCTSISERYIRLRAADGFRCLSTFARLENKGDFSDALVKRQQVFTAIKAGILGDAIDENGNRLQFPDLNRVFAQAGRNEGLTITVKGKDILDNVKKHYGGKGNNQYRPIVMLIPASDGLHFVYYIAGPARPRALTIRKMLACETDFVPYSKHIVMPSNAELSSFFDNIQHYWLYDMVRAFDVESDINIKFDMHKADLPTYPERTTSGPIGFSGMNAEKSSVTGLIMPYYNQTYLKEIQEFLDFVHSKQEGS